MSEEQNNNQPSPEEIENNKQHISLAKQIAKEAIKNLGIPHLSSGEEQFANPRWNIFYQEVKEDILLSIQVNPTTTRGILHTSLVMVVWDILREIEVLLSNPKAMAKLAVEETERESVIYNKTLRLTQDYIQYFPVVFYNSFHQTLNEVFVSHIKKFVDYDLRDYLEKSGKPNKKFTLLPNDNLNDLSKLFPETELQLIKYLGIINEEFSAYRKAAFGDRQVWLTPDAFAKLPTDYEQLKLEYKKAKVEYKIEFKAFHRVNRRATVEDWEKHWEEFFDEKFSQLFLTTEIKNLSAAQLA